MRANDRHDGPQSAVGDILGSVSVLRELPLCQATSDQRTIRLEANSEPVRIPPE